MRMEKYDSNKVFWTSDIHFFHLNILKYDKRPFSSIDEMAEKIIENWNQKVDDDSVIFIVGDVALGGKGRAEQVAKILDSLNGTKILIAGNHDTYVKYEPCRSKFLFIRDYLEVLIEDDTPLYGNKNQVVVMSHFPMLSWNHMSHRSWMIHGHQHHNGVVDPGALRVDVGINGSGYNYSPQSYWDLKDIMRTRNFVPVDHHE